ncbi:MAG: TPR end-of-group domain-containing protein [Pyrinomonadaceae bacterium]
MAELTAWLGGELVDRLGVGIDTGAHYPDARQPNTRAALALEPEPNSSITHQTFSETYALTGAYDDSARQYFASLEADGFGPDEIRPLRTAFERTGFKGFVRARIPWRKKVYAKRFTPQLIDNAWDYAFLNDKDNAFEWLAKSLDKGETDMVFLKFNPAYEGLHDDPRFKELIRKIGLP